MIKCENRNIAVYSGKPVFLIKYVLYSDLMRKASSFSSG